MLLPNVKATAMQKASVESTKKGSALWKKSSLF